jgi:hypothetical protein
MLNNTISKYINLISSRIHKDNDNKIKKEYSEYNILKREFETNPEQIYKMFKELFDGKY